MFGFDKLELSSGTTIINLLDSPYSITQSGLDLGLATLRPGTLGGNGPYTDVDCTIPINIIGACPANVYTALSDIWALLDQAQRFWKGENVNPVLITAQATGSTVAAVQALILRRNDADAPLGVPAIYETTRPNYAMQDVQLLFTRRGLWIGVTDTASSSATPAGNVFTITLPSHTVLSPVRLDMTVPTKSTLASDTYAGPIFLTTNDSAKIAVVEAETFGASGVFTVVTPAAGERARGTQVLSGAITTTETNTSTIATPSLLQQGGLFGAWAVMKGLVAYQMRLQFFVSGPTFFTPFATFQPTFGTVPQALFLGLFALPDDIGAQTYRLFAQASSADTLTIDYLVFMKIDQFSNVLTLATLQYLLSVYANGTSLKFFVDPALRTKLTPRAARATNINTLISNADYRGDATFMHAGTSLAGIILWTGGTGGSGNQYRLSDSAGALYNMTMTAARDRAYLTLP